MSQNREPKKTKRTWVDSFWIPVKTIQTRVPLPPIHMEPDVRGVVVGTIVLLQGTISLSGSMSKTVGGYLKRRATHFMWQWLQVQELGLRSFQSSIFQGAMLGTFTCWRSANEGMTLTIRVRSTTFPSPPAKNVLPARCGSGKTIFPLKVRPFFPGPKGGGGY